MGGSVKDGQHGSTSGANTPISPHPSSRLDLGDARGRQARKSGGDVIESAPAPRVNVLAPVRSVSAGPPGSDNADSSSPRKERRGGPSYPRSLPDRDSQTYRREQRRKARASNERKEAGGDKAETTSLAPSSKLRVDREEREGREGRRDDKRASWHSLSSWLPPNKRKSMGSASTHGVVAASPTSILNTGGSGSGNGTGQGNSKDGSPAASPTTGTLRPSMPVVGGGAGGMTPTTPVRPVTPGVHGVAAASVEKHQDEPHPDPQPRASIFVEPGHDHNSYSLSTPVHAHHHIPISRSHSPVATMHPLPEVNTAAAVTTTTPSAAATVPPSPAAMTATSATTPAGVLDLPPSGPQPPLSPSTTVAPPAGWLKQAGNVFSTWYAATTAHPKPSQQQQQPQTQPPTYHPSTPTSPDAAVAGAAASQAPLMPPTATGAPAPTSQQQQQTDPTAAPDTMAPPAPPPRILTSSDSPAPPSAHDSVVAALTKPAEPSCPGTPAPGTPTPAVAAHPDVPPEHIPVEAVLDGPLEADGERVTRALRGHIEAVLAAQEAIGRAHLRLEGFGAPLLEDDVGAAGVLKEDGKPEEGKKSNEEGASHGGAEEGKDKDGKDKKDTMGDDDAAKVTAASAAAGTTVPPPPPPQTTEAKREAERAEMRARQREKRAADNLVRRAQGVEDIMAKLATLATALKEYHALDTPMLAFADRGGGSRKPSLTSPYHSYSTTHSHSGTHLAAPYAEPFGGAGPMGSSPIGTLPQRGATAMGGARGYGQQGLGLAALDRFAIERPQALQRSGSAGGGVGGTSPTKQMGTITSGPMVMSPSEVGHHRPW